MTPLLATAPHEFDANLVFEGIDAYYAVVAACRDAGGGTVVTTQIEGDPYRISLQNHSSGIGALNHPSCRLETIREYRLNWERQDGVGARSGSFHIAPRTPDMVDEDGQPISTPDVTGVNVRCQGSNLAFERYPELLRAAAAAVGIDPAYFQDPHRHSNVQDAALYVRVQRGESGPVHAADGPIARVAKLLAADREGYRKWVADDTEAPGYYHTATVGPKRAGELVEFHRYAKEVKHYLPKNPDAVPRDRPLHHPKVEVSLQASRQDETVHWSDLERLQRELDEVLLNVLRWAGLPVSDEDLDPSSEAGDVDEDPESDDDGSDRPPTGGDHPYVADAYYKPALKKRQRRLVVDPTPEIEADQESVVIRAVSDGLEASDLDTLETLITDGGRVAPADIAEETDWHLDTIYRAIDRLEELVEHQYGELSLRSNYVAERVVAAVQHAREAGMDALETAAKALDQTGRLERASDQLQQWADDVGATFEQAGDTTVIDVGRVEDRYRLAEIVKNGLRWWVKSGFDSSEWADFKVRYRLDEFGTGVTRAGAVEFPRPNLGPGTRRSRRPRDRHDGSTTGSDPVLEDDRFG